MDKEKFASWLQEQLDKFEWSQADLSRKSGVSTGQITRLMSRQRGLGEKSVAQIARAFGLPPETVFRAAGILPPESDKAEKINEADHIMDELEPDRLNQGVALLRALLDYQRGLTNEPKKLP